MKSEATLTLEITLQVAGNSKNETLPVKLELPVESSWHAGITKMFLQNSNFLRLLPLYGSYVIEYDGYLFSGPQLYRLLPAAQDGKIQCVVTIKASSPPPGGINAYSPPPMPLKMWEIEQLEKEIEKTRLKDAEANQERLSLLTWQAVVKKKEYVAYWLVAGLQSEPSCTWAENVKSVITIVKTLCEHRQSNPGLAASLIDTIDGRDDFFIDMETFLSATSGSTCAMNSALRNIELPAADSWHKWVTHNINFELIQKQILLFIELDASDRYFQTEGKGNFDLQARKQAYLSLLSKADKAASLLYALLILHEDSPASKNSLAAVLLHALLKLWGVEDTVLSMTDAVDDPLLLYPAIDALLWHNVSPEKFNEADMLEKVRYLGILFDKLSPRMQNAVKFEIKHLIEYMPVSFMPKVFKAIKGMPLWGYVLQVISPATYYRCVGADSKQYTQAWVDKKVQAILDMADVTAEISLSPQLLKALVTREVKNALYIRCFVAGEFLSPRLCQYIAGALIEWYNPNSSADFSPYETPAFRAAAGLIRDGVLDIAQCQEAVKYLAPLNGLTDQARHGVPSASEALRCIIANDNITLTTCLKFFNAYISTPTPASRQGAVRLCHAIVARFGFAPEIIGNLTYDYLLARMHAMHLIAQAGVKIHRPEPSASTNKALHRLYFMILKIEFGSKDGYNVGQLVTVIDAAVTTAKYSDPSTHQLLALLVGLKALHEAQTDDVSESIVDTVVLGNPQQLRDTYLQKRLFGRKQTAPASIWDLLEAAIKTQRKYCEELLPGFPIAPSAQADPANQAAIMSVLVAYKIQSIGPPVRATSVQQSSLCTFFFAPRSGEHLVASDAGKAECSSEEAEEAEEAASSGPP